MRTTTAPTAEQEWTVNDMRLIDADALKEMLIKERDAIPLKRTERYGLGCEFPNHHGESMRGGINKAFKCMEKVPTIDAVPVVRCRDCVNGELCLNAQGAEYVVCSMDEHHVWLPNGFCSYGERRDGD